MQFSTYATPAVYTEPVTTRILEPSPADMQKPETSRFETQYPVLMDASLPKGPFLEPFETEASPKRGMSFYLAFLIVAGIGAFYIYAFMRTMFAK